MFPTNGVPPENLGPKERNFARMREADRGGVNWNRIGFDGYSFSSLRSPQMATPYLQLRCKDQNFAWASSAMERAEVFEFANDAEFKYTMLARCSSAQSRREMEAKFANPCSPEEAVDALALTAYVDETAFRFFRYTIGLATTASAVLTFLNRTRAWWVR